MTEAGPAPGDGQPAAGPARPAGKKPGGRRRSQLSRLGSLLAAAAIVVVIGLVGTRSADGSVATSVRNFLLDWQNRDYPAAAALTTGRPGAVATELSAVYSQLGAADLLLGMGPVTTSGGTAVASFHAFIDLGRGGLSWQYEGHFRLRRTASGWRVAWSPSVIVPGLRPGDRLAVLTTQPARAPLLDASGNSLIRPSPVIQLGVVPAQVTRPAVTAGRLARATGLFASDAAEMSDQIQAAPRDSFLELIQLSPASYARLRPVLAAIPDLRARTVTRRLFGSTVPVITGQIGTETARVLVEDGLPYRPGTTVGMSGLEQAYQARLAGAPTTQIVVQNQAGQTVRVLRRWSGQSATPVRTTIAGGIQQAARQALAGLGYSASIVAVRAGGGQILAVSQHQAGQMPIVQALSGSYQPGQSFTIVSTAALLSSVRGFGLSSPLPCYPRNQVGNLTNVPPVPNLGAQPQFRADFAHACGTAFGGASLLLSPGDLAATVRGTFGIGGQWRLPIPAFTGAMATPSGDGQEAADVVGSGTVLVSPLNMALAAAAVDSGTWQPPSLVIGGQTTRGAGPVALRPGVASQLRSLMALAVRSGAAQGAALSGPPVYGQVGTAPVPGHHGLWSIWFVGFRGTVAFTVTAFSRSPAFAPAVQVARQFAAALSAADLSGGS